MKTFAPLVLCTLLLAACGGKEKAAKQNAASAAAASAASSTAADEILNSAQHEDILALDKHAEADVDAGFAPPAEGQPESASGFQAASDGAEPPLPPACEAHYRRVEKCFAAQGADTEALLEMNREARADAAYDHTDAAACQALDRSFDAVAQTLGCY